MSPIILTIENFNWLQFYGGKIRLCYIKCKLKLKKVSFASLYRDRSEHILKNVLYTNVCVLLKEKCYHIFLDLYI